MEDHLLCCNKSMIRMRNHHKQSSVRSMCPIRVHWHVKQSYKEYWRVKITVTNLNVMRNYSQWNTVLLHPNLQSVTQVFSFNYKPLNQYDVMSIISVVWLWPQMILGCFGGCFGESGNVQTEILFHKDEGIFTFGQGWVFLRRVMFNGDECVMPPPDIYPTLPNNAPLRLHQLSSSFSSPVLLLVVS
ncbi:hypothetical protein Ddye_007484 [Dipteronia dyeriana]|uniref:COBRA C-terminal domain-containing protein n=1 Tax=Dipteronia dyeriana TaxID=168575 RepID=A0AAD9XKI4_9ROSI|nr:hypothetical protein Ddye_007484 [Dipteronia dyeriana]